MPKNDENTTMGLIRKKATSHVQHTFFCTFLCRCFARLQRKTSRNFQVTRFIQEMSCVFQFTFFTAAHFHLALVAANISHFLTARRYNIFMSFFQQKMSLRFRSLSPILFVALPWPAACFLFFSVCFKIFSNL